MPNNKSRKALCIALAAITALTLNLGCAAEELPAENALTENNEQTSSENIQAVSEENNTDRENRY